jgi:hypothetical protein
MEFIPVNKKNDGINNQFALRSIILIGLLITAETLFATMAVSSGQLLIINSLANVSVSGTTGNTASKFSLVVSDSVGPCSTTALVPYNGTVTVTWASSNTHSSSVCTSIASVAVTPLSTSIGAVTSIVYDSSSSTIIPATHATTAITYTPPTTVYANLSLIISGTGVPSSPVTASSTTWGIGAASAPVFNTGNGSLSTIGVPGGTGSGGLKAQKIMSKYSITPIE